MKNNNDSKYRFVAIGDIVIDCIYDKENNLITASGGGSKFNVITRLALYVNNTALISGCGNDEYGQKEISFLNSIGVDLKHTIIENVNTRIYELHKLKNGDYESKKKNWYKDSIVTFDNVLNNVKSDDVIIMDSLHELDLNVIKKTSNKKVIDLGRDKIVKRFDNEQLSSILTNNFEIIQVNENVYKALFEKIRAENIYDVYDFLQPKLLIVTYGSKGATFITDNGFWNMPIKDPAKEIDATGAGDAFFSVVIDAYFKNILENKYPDERYVSDTFERSLPVTKKVVLKLGARGDLK